LTRQGTAAVAAALAGTLAAGCGRPIVSGPRADEPLLTLGGRIDSDATSLGSSLRLALVWVDPLGVWNDRPSPVGLEARTLDPDTREFVLSLYAPPPEDYLRRFPRRDRPAETSFAVAVAELVAYLDDGDETFTVGDRILGSPIAPHDFFAGAATSHAIVYVEQPHDTTRDPPAIPAWDDVLSRPPGYHLAECKEAGLEDTLVVAAASAPVVVVVPSCGATPSPCPQLEFPAERSCLGSHATTPGQ
jgi:hypothetical protein